MKKWSILFALASLLMMTSCGEDHKCGDGITDIGDGEACDDGNTENGDGCSDICQLESTKPGTDKPGTDQPGTDKPGTDKPGTNTAVCGNGKKEGSEACDDGNKVSGDGCSATCTVEDNDPPAKPVCGDGKKEGSEACDDGNKVSGDGCSATCTVEDNNTPAKPVCGDGKKEGSEACDDGNKVSGDGCSATCTVEDNDPPATPVCGDGKKEGSEACDDGNKVSGDGCSATCTVETPSTSKCPVVGSSCETLDEMLCCENDVYGCVEENDKLLWGIIDCEEESKYLNFEAKCHSFTDEYGTFAECTNECDAKYENDFTYYSEDCIDDAFDLWVCFKTDEGKYANFKLYFASEMCWSDDSMISCDTKNKTVEMTCSNGCSESEDTGVVCE